MATFNVGGTRIINVGDTGIEDDDVATKKYVDGWHEPVEYRDCYIKYIKSRFFLLVPISGLCKVSTDLIIKGGQIHTVLEGNSASNSFYFENQSVKGKYIQLSYLQDVWVEEWILMTSTKEQIDVKFKWQASSDKGKSWIDISDAKFTSTDVAPIIKDISMNKGQWNFINPDPINEEKRYSYWRLKGVSGAVTSHPYINIMYMTLR